MSDTPRRPPHRGRHRGRTFAHEDEPRLTLTITRVAAWPFLFGELELEGSGVLGSLRLREHELLEDWRPVSP